MEAETASYHHVDAASSPHSRTVTPTAAVRPRPRPPLALSARSRSIEHPMMGGDGATTDAVDDLAGALTELGRTDFVRKYSRKSRPVRPNVDRMTAATATSPTAHVDVRSAGSSPVVSPRYQQLRCDVAGSEDRDTTPTDADRHDIPAQRRGGDAQHPADQSVTGARRRDITDEKTAESDDVTSGSLRSPRAGAGLRRSESDASKVRSLTLRSLRPRTMAAVGQSPPPPQTVAHVPPPAPRGGGVATPPIGDRALSNSAGADTDDEGVGAVDIDEPSYTDTYVSVTAAGSFLHRGGALLPIPQQYRDPSGSATARGRHQRFADLGGPVVETSGTTSTQKTSGGGRFQTHPPLRERGVTHEPGSVDSNGLGALRDVADPAKQVLGLASQVSFSSADSHICPSEDLGSSLSHFGGGGSGGDGDCSAESSRTTSATPDHQQLVRKNSKTQKQKSRSDPTRGADKNADASAVDITSIVSGTMHTQSSPVLLENDDDDRRRGHLPTTQFPFTADSASTSDELSDRGGGGGGGGDGVAAGHSAKSSTSESPLDVAVRVAIKSDDSFDDLPPTGVKPPRPKPTKKRPRAPPSPLTTPAAAAPAGDTSSSASSLVRKVFSKDRNGGGGGGVVAGRLLGKDAGGGGDSPADLPVAAPSSSLTLPLSKRSSLLRSHSSAGNGAAGSAGSAAAAAAAGRSKHAELPQSLAISRQRSPGAPDSVDVAPRTGVVTASASVPELCDASSGSRLQSKDHASLSTSYTPSLEPVLSSSTFTLFDGPAGDKVRFQTQKITRIFSKLLGDAVNYRLHPSVL